MPPLKTILLAASALTLTACAGGPPPGGPNRDRGPGPGPGEGPPPAPRQQVFISPAGEPFRTSGPAPYPVSVWFAGADLDHDNALTRGEFVADAQRFFGALDVNRDGALDSLEVSAYETRIAPEILGAMGPGAGGPPQARRGPPGGGPGGPPGGGRRPDGVRDGGAVGGVLQGAAPYGLIAEPQPVMGADADFNRRITAEEAQKAAKARFALLDRDGDGRLALADLPRTRVQSQAEGPGRTGGKPRRHR